MLEGKGVSEANGVRVSVSVGVGEPVAVGWKGVSVTGGNDVLVGRLVSTEVAGTGVEVSVQAKEMRMPKSKKNGFRLISEIFSPVRILYPNEKEGNSLYRQIKIPVRTGRCVGTFRAGGLMLSLIIAA